MFSKNIKTILILLVAFLLLGGSFFLFQEKLFQNLATDISVGGEEYKSITPEMQRIDENNSSIDKYGHLAVDGGAIHMNRPPIDYRDYRRVRFFIPPGMAQIDIRYYFSASNRYKFLASFNAPPSGDPNNPPAGCSLGQPVSIDEISSGAVFCGSTNLEGSMRIIDGGVRGNGLDPEKGGWLYVKINDENTSVFGIGSVLSVNVEGFNNWWDNYGSNPDGSINWEKDIESVTTYTAKKKLQGDIEPQSSPDGDVDIFDYNVFIQYWSQSPTNNPADIDQNGKVDIFDYNILVGNFGKTSS